MSRVVDFLPTYPLINDDKFQEKIASLKEFADLRLEPVEPKPNPGEYFNFQTLLARYLSSHTPYNGMLFYLEIGVGKTCTSIAVHELIKRYYVVDNPSIKFNKTLVLARGEILLENYKNEFLNVCPGFGKDLDTIDKRRLLKENFEFHPLQRFANNVISKKSDKGLKGEYSNRLIVIDEGQDLKKHTSKPGQVNIYKSLQRFFDAIDDPIIIIMSGEPIVEKPYEPVALVNLFTPKDERLPIEKKFMNEFYDKDGTLKNTEKLEKFFQGRVSYVRQMGSVAPHKFMQTNEERKQWFRELQIYACCMSDFQKKVYYKSIKKVTTRKAKENIMFEIEGRQIQISQLKRTKEGEFIEIKTTKGGNFYQYSRESSMFVYPDGTYGSDGFKKHIERRTPQNRYTYSIPKEWKTAEYFGSIENLRKYSCKYASAIEIILNNPQRVFYIYSELVNNSGLILFSLILELYSFRQASIAVNETSSKQKRYVLLSHQTSTPKLASKLIENISRPYNVRGEYIQVILGSEMIGYGITIKNATGVIILTSQWNVPSMQQIYGRTIRPGSDQYLVENKLNNTVEIYLMCAIDCEKDEETTDVIMYQIAEEKKILNDPINNILKKTAADCPLMYKRNVLKASENYECSSMKHTSVDEKNIYVYDPPFIDDTNYNLLYSEKDVEANTEKIKLHFTKNYTMKIENDILFLLSVQYMIDERIPVTNPLGSISYIKENNNILYLQNILSDDNDLNELYYVQHPLMNYSTSLEQIIEINGLKNDGKLVKKFCDEKNVQKALNIFHSMNVYTKILCFENSYNAIYGKIKAKGVEKNKATGVIKEYESKFYVIDDIAYHLLYAEKITGTSYNISVKRLLETGKMRKFQNSKWSWVSVLEENEINTKLKKTERETMKETIEENKYGMYGTLSSKDFKFRVVLSGGKGLVCTSYSIEQLFDIVVTLDEYPPVKDYIKKLSKDEVKTFLTRHTKLTNQTIIDTIKNNKVTLNRMKEYLTVLDMDKKEEICEFIKKIMRKKDILYDI